MGSMQGVYMHVFYIYIVLKNCPMFARLCTTYKGLSHIWPEKLDHMLNCIKELVTTACSVLPKEL